MTINYTEVGKDTERKVTRYLRASGAFPKAERFIRTGWNAGGRSSADEGDIRNTGRVCFQVKSLRPESRAERMVGTWMAETVSQAKAAGAELPVLILRRWTITDVSKWWAFLRLEDLTAPMFKTVGAIYDYSVMPKDIIIRMTMRELLEYLAFYGLSEGNPS